MVACHSHRRTRLCSISSENMNLNSLENAFFSLSPPPNTSQKCIIIILLLIIITGESFEAQRVLHTHCHACSAVRCGRRGCSDAVIQWAPASSGRERSTSVSAALLRQTSKDGGSLRSREEDTGLRELLRSIWRRRRRRRTPLFPPFSDFFSLAQR